MGLMKKLTTIASLALTCCLLQVSCEKAKVATEENKAAAEVAEDAASTNDSETPAAEEAPKLAFESYDVSWDLPIPERAYGGNFVNKEAPDYTVETWISDAPETEGKFVFIDFWATWCPPCRAMIPHMNELQEKYGSKAAFIGISDEPEEKVKAFKGHKDRKTGEMHVIEYANGIDTSKKAKKALGIKGIPSMMIVDPNGKVVWVGHPGYVNDQLVEKIFTTYEEAAPKS